MRYIPANMAGSVENLLRFYDRAGPDTRAQGVEWYEVANTHLVAVGKRHGYSLIVAAAVTAALSPFIAWNKNLELAEELLAGGEARGSFPQNRAKALAIMAGADPREVLAGPKVRAFFECLAHPGATDDAVVDRHMLKAWLDGASRGQYGCGPTVYRKAVADVQDGARLAGLKVHQFQATVWLVARRTD